MNSSLASRCGYRATHARVGSGMDRELVRDPTSQQPGHGLAAMLDQRASSAARARTSQARDTKDEKILAVLDAKLNQIDPHAFVL